VDAQVDAYVPANYIGLEAVKVDLHRRIALAGDRGELRDLAVELADRFGPPPEPVENLIAIQEARLVAAELGADVVTLRAGKLTVGPVVLDSGQVRQLKDRCPQAVYTVASREVTCRLAPMKAGAKLTMRQGLDVLDAIVESRRLAAA
jgi:transcription-repair coupling factor (superfamily II helicase)